MPSLDQVNAARARLKQRGCLCRLDYVGSNGEGRADRVHNDECPVHNDERTLRVGKLAQDERDKLDAMAGQ